MKKFTLYWLTGKREVVVGQYVSLAMTIAGYGAGALRALDFYADGDNHNYEYVDGKWTRKDDESRMD